MIEFACVRMGLCVCMFVCVFLLIGCVSVISFACDSSWFCLSLHVFARVCMNVFVFCLSLLGVVVCVEFFVGCVCLCLHACLCFCFLYVDVVRRRMRLFVCA